VIVTTVRRTIGTVDDETPGARDGGPVLSMTVNDVMLSTLKGAVLLGELEGSGRVGIGDLAICDDRTLEICGFDRFRQTPAEVTGGSGAVGVAVGDIEDAAALRGKVLRFAPRPAFGMPSLTEGGVVVPDQGVLVGFSEHQRSPARKFAVLILDGMRVRLVDGDDCPLVDAAGEQLCADRVSRTQVALRCAHGSVFYLVGPQEGWAKQRAGAELVQRYRARVVPDLRLADDEGHLAKFMITPATTRLRHSKLWASVLLKMLRTRGVQPLPEGR
jgi:hypothetical protein